MDPLQTGDPANVGPYRLLGRLGTGGMGQVFLGRDGRGRLAAVKVVHDSLLANPEFRQRFAREIDIAARVRAPWTVVLLDADPNAPRPWMATDYVAGPSLEQAVRAGPLPEVSVGALGQRLAEALAALHATGLIHRDVKPSNVLLADDGPRLLDFGIARAADTTRITHTGLSIGTPAYMSPEQARGEDSGPPSDVFSLASVLTFAATGEGPFGYAPSPVAMLRRVSDGDPDLSGLPDRLRAELRPCLARKPEKRPTAAQFAQRLAHWSASEARAGRRRPAWSTVALVVLSVIALALLAVVIWLGRRDAAPPPPGAALPAAAPPVSAPPAPRPTSKATVLAAALTDQAVDLPLESPGEFSTEGYTLTNCNGLRIDADSRIANAYGVQWLDRANPPHGEIIHHVLSYQGDTGTKVIDAVRDTTRAQCNPWLSGGNRYVIATEPVLPTVPGVDAQWAMCEQKQPPPTSLVEAAGYVCIGYFARGSVVSSVAASVHGQDPAGTTALFDRVARQAAERLAASGA